MTVNGCIPVVPSADLERSLRFWRDGLGFTETWWEARSEEKLIGCGIRKDRMSFMLNRRAGSPAKPENYEGVRFYWAPHNLHALREHLAQLGYAVSDIEARDYGQTEFFLTDDDGFEHCFGVATAEVDAKQ
jgi:catechol 2,3-dioxygenase-like lactoylglutathione lyase family enzyme